MSAARTVRQRDRRELSRAVAANAVILQGAIVCINATGYATKGATSTTLKADGVARETVDNTGGADGAQRVPVKRGTFQFFNSASTDAITLADIGNTAYIVDDQTVAKTNGSSTRSAAGTIVDVDAQGVWVAIG